MSGNVTNDNQYKGNKKLDEEMRKSKDTSGGESLDKKDSPDQENLRTIADEADLNSNVGVESRRTRSDISENPSKDN
ncbi:MAG: elastin-binding protein EbpS [Peptoniphilaceae bacterium]|nr:elastin-binding protein EbpS [Peptoniphilaceae bacterium]MDY6019609.1 elastin-binding protein EbpS [Anaerococcus sp.]